jgi:hypothetical protein
MNDLQQVVAGYEQRNQQGLRAARAWTGRESTRTPGITNVSIEQIAKADLAPQQLPQHDAEEAAEQDHAYYRS